MFISYPYICTYFRSCFSRLFPIPISVLLFIVFRKPDSETVRWKASKSGEDYEAVIKGHLIEHVFLANL